jgi:hypothetical protein
VTIDEPITGVNISLGFLSLDSCPQFDIDESKDVSIDELVLGVISALEGCA